ncbi:MAG: RNA polymerase sigma factor [Gammaproteobacteria bacterium]
MTRAMPDGPRLRHNPLIDERELEQLHEQCFSWALTCAQGRRHDAEDILQMTYLAILEGEAKFGGHSSLRTWLFAVIRNQAASRWRRARRSLAAFTRLAVFAPAQEPQADPDDPVQGQERTRVLAALRSLPKRQGELLDLVFYRDLSIAEAAEVLGIALGTARIHYERGKAALRERLADLGPGT